jgi:hypothetical protein
MRQWMMAGLGLGLASGALCPTANRGDFMDVRLAVRTDRSGYAPGDSLVVVLTLTNPEADTAVFRFATGQRFDVEVRDADGQLVWRWAQGMMFMQMLGAVRVPPGDSVVYRVPAVAPAGPGRYTVVGRIPATDQALEARAEITVRP